MYTAADSAHTTGVTRRPVTGNWEPTATVTAIATEKAGLIRPGQVVISAAEGEALAIIAATCAERGATLWPVRALSPASDPVGQEATFEDASGTVPRNEVLVTPDTNAADTALTIRTPLRAYDGPQHATACWGPFMY